MHLFSCIGPGIPLPSMIDASSICHTVPQEPDPEAQRHFGRQHCLPLPGHVPECQQGLHSTGGVCGELCCAFSAILHLCAGLSASCSILCL